METCENKKTDNTTSTVHFIISFTIPPVFKADRPFTYMLVKDTGNGQKEVLFAGQYVTGK